MQEEADLIELYEARFGNLNQKFVLIPQKILNLCSRR